MKNNYLIEGSYDISLDNNINKIIKDMSFNDAIINTYDLEETLINNALEDLDTYGLLSNKKVIIIKNISILSYEENKSKIEHLLNYLKNYNENNLLFICDNKFDDRKKIIKELKKNMTYLKASFNAIDYIKKELSSYKVENEVISLINEYCMEDLSMIKNECNKLKNYKSDTKTITKQDYLNIGIKKREDITNKSFEFIRSIAKKDKKNSLKLFNDLCNNGYDAIGMIGLLASQIRIMIQVKILSEKNLSNNEITNMLGEKSPYRISKTKELIKYYSIEELIELTKKLADIDLKVKTESVDANLLMQLFILNL